MGGLFEEEAGVALCQAQLDTASSGKMYVIKGKTRHSSEEWGKNVRNSL